VSAKNFVSTGLPIGADHVDAIYGSALKPKQADCKAAMSHAQ
jgi:hypothetical protein